STGHAPPVANPSPKPESRPVRSHEPAAPAAPLRNLSELSWRQRFHIRLTRLNGVVLVLLLTGVDVVFYEFAYQSEFRALQQRIRSTVDFLGRAIDAEVYEDIIRAPSVDKPLHKAL